MGTTVQKWGNSLGIRVPKAIAQQFQLTSGSEVEFDTKGDVLTIRPTKRRRRSKYTLAELMKGYKGPSPYQQLDGDRPVGKELL